VKHVRTVKPIAYLLGLAGGTLFIVLLIRERAEQVGLAIARVGWGLLALALYHLVQTLSDAVGCCAAGGHFPVESGIGVSPGQLT